MSSCFPTGVVVLASTLLLSVEDNVYDVNVMSSCFPTGVVLRIKYVIFPEVAPCHSLGFAILFIYWLLRVSSLLV